MIRLSTVPWINTPGYRYSSWLITPFLQLRLEIRMLQASAGNKKTTGFSVTCGLAAPHRGARNKATGFGEPMASSNSAFTGSYQHWPMGAPFPPLAGTVDRTMYKIFSIWIIALSA
jgi:hypothetical protein